MRQLILLLIFPTVFSPGLSLVLTPAMEAAVTNEVCMQHCPEIEQLKSATDKLKVPESIMAVVREYIELKSCTSSSGIPGHLCKVLRKTNSKPSPLPRKPSLPCGKVRVTQSARVAMDIGQEDHPGSWPWMVSYGRPDPRNSSKWIHMCGGTLISDDTVLTSAHCYNGMDKFWIRVGDTDLESFFDDFSVVQEPVSSIDIHPRYLDGQAYFDVALMRLESPVKINDYVLPVCLPEVPSQDPDTYAEKLVTLTGWGLQDRNGLRNNHYLQRVHMGIFSQRYCNNSYDLPRSHPISLNSKNFVPNLFTSNVICAGYEKGGIGSCPGDSGGPLVRYTTNTRDPRYVQVGIVSGGIGRCGDKNFPGVYVRVDDEQVLNFIRGMVPTVNTVSTNSDDTNPPSKPNPARLPEGTKATFCHVPGECVNSFYLDSWPAKTETECQRACQAHEGCRYYTHFGAEPRCAGYADCVKVQEPVDEETGVLKCPNCVSGEVTCGAATGSDVTYDIPDEFEEDALSWAARQGNVSVVKYLTSKGDVNLNTIKGHGMIHQRTPIFFAAMEGHFEVVRALIKGGADGDQGDEFGQTPLMAATLEGHLSVASYLVENGIDIMARKEGGFTALHHAAQEGHLSLLRLMVSTRPPSLDINVLSDNGRTPIYNAAFNDHAEVIEYLHSQGGDVNKADNGGRTPLWKAAMHNAPNSIRMLYRLGADPSQPMFDGTRPLHAAAFTGATKAIQALVEDAGVDVNEARRSNGSTALHLAAQEGKSEAVELLLGLGADKKIRNRRGETALDKARAYGHFRIARMLA